MQAVALEPAPQRVGNVDDSGYEAHLQHLAEGFRRRVGDAQLFTTDASGLWDAYLAAFPESERQFHTCNACRHFIERYGHLVLIGADGELTPAVWCADDVQGHERDAFAVLERIVRVSKVTGVFRSSQPVWGTPTTGVWRHMSLSCPDQCQRFSRVLTAGQAMAEKREDFVNMRRALAEYSAPVVEQALALLKSDALYRSEKVLGQAEWLTSLRAAVDAAPKRLRDNLLWRFVGAAPAGFCHPRSSMIGTLLDDIAAGVSFETASSKFAQKMHPLRYQRPQAAPSAGAIQAAERLVADLGIARSLDRRFARLEELTLLWKPVALEAPSSVGVFGHIKAKGAPQPLAMVAPPQPITWVKFASTVLPDATRIEAQIGYGNVPFYAFLTATHDDAPPILQWDQEGARNPFSWYTYNGGSSPREWGLMPGWVRVTGIARHPAHWRDGFEHHGKGSILLLEGCRDSKTDQGNALFPETLKTELRTVRAVIEAYSKAAKIAGADQATACGLGAIGATVRVVGAAGVVTQYRIDRWD